MKDQKEGVVAAWRMSWIVAVAPLGLLGDLCCDLLVALLVRPGRIVDFYVRGHHHENVYLGCLSDRDDVRYPYSRSGRRLENDSKSDIVRPCIGRGRYGRVRRMNRLTSTATPVPRISLPFSFFLSDFLRFTFEGFSILFEL